MLRCESQMLAIWKRNQSTTKWWHKQLKIQVLKKWDGLSHYSICKIATHAISIVAAAALRRERCALEPLGIVD